MDRVCVPRLYASLGEMLSGIACRIARLKGANPPRQLAIDVETSHELPQRSRTVGLDSRNKAHDPHAQDGSHPSDHGGRQVERRDRRERLCLIDLTTDLHVETNTVEKGCEIVAVL